MVMPLWVLLLGWALAAPALGEEHEPFLEAQLQPEAVYVQAQAIYTVRLYRSSLLQQGRLLQPEARDLVLVALGEDRQRQVGREGRLYHLTERRYAVFPQASGVVRLPGAAFSGRELYSRAPDLALEVRPRPGRAPGETWLPARRVEVTEEWSADPAGLRAGEVAVRTLILAAHGLAAAQLPKLPPPELAGVRVYADPPRLEERPSYTGGIEGRRIERHTFFVAHDQAGTLPAIEVPWWDTTADAPRLARLPERTVGHGPTAVASDALPHSAAEMATPPGSEPASSVGEEADADTDTGASTAVLPVVLAAGLVLLLRWRRPLARRRRVWQAIRAVSRACRAGDPQAARAALERWAVLARAGRRSGPVAELLEGEEARAALRQLDEALYSGRSGVWDGPACWRALGPALRRGASRPKARGEPPLAPLNP
jgi:hypothetical protein